MELSNTNNTTNNTNNECKDNNTNNECINPLEGFELPASVRVFVHKNQPPSKKNPQAQRSFLKRSRPSTHTIAGDAQAEDALFAQTARVMIVECPSPDTGKPQQQRDMLQFLTKASDKLHLSKVAAKMYCSRGRCGKRIRSLNELKEGDRLFLAMFPDERFWRDRPSSMRFHYAMFGGSNVGKTALLKRYTSNQFIEFYCPSLEEPLRTTRAVAKCPCAMQILDTGGSSHQVQFSLHRWTKGLNGCLLCFDATRVDETLQLLKPYVAAMLKHQQSTDSSWTQKGCPMVLVACKLDLLEHGRNGKANSRGSGGSTLGGGGGGGGSGGGSGSIGKDRNRKLLKTLRAKAKKFVHQYKCAGYVETSALDGDGVEDAFSTLTKKVLGQLSGGSKMTVDRLIEEGDESRSNNMDGSKGVCCFGCCT